MTLKIIKSAARPIAARLSVTSGSRFASSTPAAPPRRETIFSGIQPSGTPHLGNLLGALSNWVDLQASAPPETSIFYSIVGLHAITIPKDPKVLLRERSEMLASLLAVGIDPERSTLFHQDMVPEHSELAWILNCITPIGALQRMTTWKGKIATSKNAASEDEVSESELHLGLFAYPVLQAADILLYKSTIIPVGEDQQQHLELARDIAISFNHRFGKKTFPLPRHQITPSKRILSLRDPSQKMSKSSPDANSRILITDTAEMIQKKLRSSVTDSILGITYDPKTRPGVSNLLTILAACEGRGDTPEKVAERYADWTWADFKSEVADSVEGVVAPIRTRLDALKGEEAYLQQVSRQGQEKARERAGAVLSEVKRKVGLQPI